MNRFMREVKKFNQAEISKLQKLIIGLIIDSIEYSVNTPLEDNCLSINFTNGGLLNIYALSRIIIGKTIFLCSADYYFDKNFCEKSNPQQAKETLMDIALQKTNEALKNGVITEVKANNYGDLTIVIGSDIRIEIFFDTPEIEKDYFTFYTEYEYFSLCKIEDRMVIIEDLNE